MSIGLVVLSTGCRPAAPPSATAQPPVTPRVVPAAIAPTPQPFTAIPLQHVHNVHRVTDKVISGSQPEGEAGLKELAALGVKTIISVDGITPDAETARRLGMRYIHLPHGYDSVPAERAKEIAKAINELPGPIYIHCHHGKHRSAAAVAAACVINGSIAPDRAEAVLRTFGTGLNYKGLWASARDARPIERAVLAALPVEYRDKAKVSDMASAMVKIDLHFDHLKQIQKAGWIAPPDHPDLDPPHEALQLQEHLVEVGRSDEGQKESADFHRLLKANADAAARLRELLTTRPIDKAAAEAAFKATGQSCLDCHKAFRD